MRVEVAQRRLGSYEEFAKDDVERIRDMAKDLKGLKVLHINATSYGGGVAELLHTLVPLMRDVGIDAEWEVIEAPMEFFNVTKKIHNTLQGADIEITDEEWELYERVNRENASKLDLNADIVVVHDPQPAAVLSLAGCRSRAVWRCHIDLSSPNESVWSKFKEYIEDYDIFLFHMKEYFPRGFEDRSVEFPPSIDPLSEKNRELSRSEIDEVIKRFELDTSKPILTVVARFDPWKDLFGAIDVYRTVKKEIDVQLYVVSAMAHDDPEGWVFHEKVLRYACRDDGVKFLTNLIGVNSREVNAIQRISTLGLHTATKEGFGLVISEMMWKGNPVVARPAGGVKIQIDDGINGYLRWDVEELAESVLTLLKDPDLREEMGKKAREKVKENFLTTSHLRRYIEIFKRVL